MAKLGFNVGDYEGVTGGEFEAFPPGEYELMCVEAELTDTSKGDGQYIAGKFEVVGPTEAGRLLWTNFNVHNPSEKGEKFGRRMLAGWARACGRPNAKDTDELLQRKFKAIVGIEKGTGGYKDKNVITGFPEATAGVPQAEKPAASTAPAAPPDPYAGQAPHVKQAVDGAGGLDTPAGQQTYKALTGKEALGQAAKPPTATPPDPYSGQAPHVKSAVDAAGGLDTAPGQATYKALTGKDAPGAPAAAATKPAAATAAKPAATTTAAGGKQKAPWDE